MKKISAISCAIAFLLLFAADLIAQPARVIVKEAVTVTVDRANVATDVPPIMENGRTMVPVRGVFNAFNADIGWFPIEQQVFVRSEGTVIWLKIGDAHAKVNDEIVPLDVPALIYQGRTMVPLRFIAEALGATVTWDANARTVTIVTRKTAVPS